MYEVHVCNNLSLGATKDILKIHNISYNVSFHTIPGNNMVELYCVYQSCFTDIWMDEVNDGGSEHNTSNQHCKFHD